MAEWIREKCDRMDIEAVEAPMQQREAIEEPVRKVTAEQPVVGKSVGKCPHRKQKGELCYKCDPKWGFPCLME